MRFGIGLGEFLEQPPDLLLVHSNTGIRHRNRDPAATVDPLLARCEGDRAVFRELVGIARQVEQRLPNADLIGVDGADVRPARKRPFREGVSGSGRVSGRPATQLPDTYLHSAAFLLIGWNR